MTKADMDEERIRASLDAIVGQIRRYVPSMAPYFEIDRPLGEYAAGLQPTWVDPVHAERQEGVARAVRRVLRQAFGPAAAGLSVDARDVRAINIVDHHQLLNHPLLLGTNIIANADRLVGGGDRRPIVTFSCSNVPPSNHYMRNGFQFRGETIPYFRAKEHRDAMYYTGVRSFDFVERLRTLRRWDRFTPDDQDFLIEYQGFLNGLDHPHTDRHRDQLAVALRHTWPLLFARELRRDIPELLYANSEDVARECLLELLTEENFLSAALFDPGFRQQVLDAFRGVVVAWDEAADKGTHFFWRKYPGRPRLLRLYAEGSELVPADPRFRHLTVPLELAAVRDHLEREEIIPSVALCMSVLLYAGVKPLVGPGSLVYTTQLRDGWTALLDRHGHPAEAARVAQVDTAGLIAGTPMFFGRSGDAVRTLYAADVFSGGGMSESYMKTVLNAPLKDLLSVGSSGVYSLFSHSYIPKEERLTERIGFDEAATLIHGWV
ncbi:hypothetical protein I3J09_27190 [Streptomyces clavuligerus]|uniref:hypothetical protein n=2 Tax=Streptomyces clavuligerus TaxID=1901 RepID=UPI00081082C8|nr:hypothetical protein [Streptomyces clavuligerus]ANW21567.1 hypothetical protein BB341_26820 [Streptomyces clavuligerus]AXU16195.1 hypothetical protein D1794_27875 [Streptomyces clavuligerus]QPL66181.1 hypothetical protein I3J04_27175 [Streptomyces clavuligerus]QPL71714.1 hypothetical protein I3J05_24380 [Streptomyces clavuligerus]QPL78293.1 hypothetical protein I3J06_27190 [Streptomyces clavuligerus]